MHMRIYITIYIYIYLRRVIRKYSGLYIRAIVIYERPVFLD